MFFFQFYNGYLDKDFLEILEFSFKYEVLLFIWNSP